MSDDGMTLEPTVVPQPQPRLFDDAPRYIYMRGLGRAAGSYARPISTPSPIPGGSVLLPFNFPSSGKFKFLKQWTIRNPVLFPGPDGRVGGIVNPRDGVYFPLYFPSGKITIRRVQTRYVLLDPSVTSLFPNSRVRVLSFGPSFTGGLSEFAFWDSDSPDPLQGIVHSVASGPIGGVGQPWTRHSATVTLPDKARYVGVGGRFVAVPDSPAYYNMKNVMLQTADLAGTYPTDFEPARSIKADIKPERVNWSVNPAFWNDAATWGVSPAEVNVPTGTFARFPEPRVRSGYVGRAAMAANGLAYVTHVVDALLPNRRYRAQVTVRADRPVVINQYRDSQVIFVTGSPDPVPNAVGVTLWIEFITTTPGPITLFYRVDNRNNNGVANVDFSEMIVETSDGGENLTYFDGSTGGEYVWRLGYPVGSGQSMYYKNRLERFAATKRILADNAPMGIGQGTPTFGTLPNS